MAKRKKKRQILEATIEEISITSAPATREHFALVKSSSSDEPDELAKLLKELYGDDIAPDDEIFLKAKDLPDEAKEALTQAVKKLNVYLSDFPDDVLQAIKVLGKFGGYGSSESYGEKPKKKPKDYGYMYPEKRDEAKQKSLAKSGALWPSLAAAMGGGPAAEPGENDLPEAVPQLRSLSKAVKGQGDEEIEEENLWPSLG
jgi:hypothetical protein